jgi:hypothetical protein
LFGDQGKKELTWTIGHNFLQTFEFEPIPQFALPLIEAFANRSRFYDAPIESQVDQNKEPKARYDNYTSQTMIQLGKWLDFSPKMMEHIFKGYTGTIGGYALSLADLFARAASGAPDQPGLRARDIPVLNSIYQTGDPRTTQCVTDFYDMLQSATQAYNTLRAIPR